MEDIINQILTKQRETCNENKKLTYKDMSKIMSRVNNEDFLNSESCILWNKKSNTIKTENEITNKRNIIQRLLYENFMGDLKRTQFIKFRCRNISKCCNIKHFYKCERSDKNKDKDCRLNKREKHIVNKSKSEKDLFISLD